MRNFIYINGIELPQPKRGLNLQVATIVDSARNANGVVVGQKVGRDQQKINDLEWAALPAAKWEAILQAFQNFFVTVSYPDMVTGGYTTRRMYPGNREAEPLWLDKSTGLPKTYINCKVNLIDVGEDVISTQYYATSTQYGTITESGSRTAAMGRVIVDDTALQSKTVTPTKSTQDVKPDDTYGGLKLVTVNPIPTRYQDVSTVTASAEDVRTGKTFVNSNGVSVAGTLDYVDTTDATATAENIMSGKTAYVNGTKLIGTAAVKVSGTKLIMPEGLVEVNG